MSDSDSDYDLFNTYQEDFIFQPEKLYNASSFRKNKKSPGSKLEKCLSIDFPKLEDAPNAAEANEKAVNDFNAALFPDEKINLANSLPSNPIEKSDERGLRTSFMIQDFIGVSSLDSQIA